MSGWGRIRENGEDRGPRMFNALFGRIGRLVSLLPWLLSACLLLGAFSTSCPAAGTILSTGFESPYVAGSLEGQQGWVANTGASTAIVQNSVAHSGSQALLVTRAANSDKRWAVPNLTGIPSQQYVAVDWDMRVAGPAGNPALTEFGPFFGVEGYDADSGILLLGSLGVDATTGDVLYQLQDTGALTESGSTVSFNQWYHFKLVFDFLNDSYRGFVNGTLVANTGFVDRSFNLDNFTDADISTLAAYFNPQSQALGGSAVFDNFVVRDGLAGDYDADGDVDNADYAPWRTAFGSTVTAGHGADGNRNGVVDAADYVTWRKNFGQS